MKDETMKKTLLALATVLVVALTGLIVLRSGGDDPTSVASPTTTSTVTIPAPEPGPEVTPVTTVTTSAKPSNTTATVKVQTTVSTVRPTVTTSTTVHNPVIVGTTTPTTTASPTTTTTSKPAVTTTTTSKPAVTTTTSQPKYTIVNHTSSSWEGCHVWYRDDKAHTYTQELFDKYSNVACKNVGGPRKTRPNEDPVATMVKGTSIVWVDWVGPGEIDCPNIPASGPYNGNTALWWSDYQKACPGYDQPDGWYPVV